VAEKNTPRSRVAVMQVSTKISIRKASYPSFLLGRKDNVIILGSCEITDDWFQSPGASQVSKQTNQDSSVSSVSTDFALDGPDRSDLSFY
jgi:hypothetical protein